MSDNDLIHRLQHRARAGDPASPGQPISTLQLRALSIPVLQELADTCTALLDEARAKRLRDYAAEHGIELP